MFYLLLIYANLIRLVFVFSRKANEDQHSSKWYDNSVSKFKRIYFQFCYILPHLFGFRHFCCAQRALFGKPTATCRKSDVKIRMFQTVINLLNSVQNMTQTVRTLLNSVLMILGERPFVAQNVSSLLFKGYKDPIFTLFTLAKKLRPDIPLNIPDKMGFFYPQNLSCDGTYVIDSGYGDVENVGKILLWNGNTSINDWLSPQANMINGSGKQYKKKKHSLRKQVRLFQMVLFILLFSKNLRSYRCLLRRRAGESTCMLFAQIL